MIRLLQLAAGLLLKLAGAIAQGLAYLIALGIVIIVRHDRRRLEHDRKAIPHA